MAPLGWRQTTSASTSTSTLALASTPASTKKEKKKKSHPLIFIPRLEWEVLPFYKICLGRFRISWMFVLLVLEKDILGFDIGYVTICMYWIWLGCESLAMPWSLRVSRLSRWDITGRICHVPSRSMSLSRCHGRRESLWFGTIWMYFEMKKYYSPFGFHLV